MADTPAEENWSLFFPKKDIEVEAWKQTQGVETEED